jgi:N-hydroxyarylamine O-acetyltransferase
MTAPNFSLSDYLRRIGYGGETRPDLATLSALMSAQLQSVPFENTEVQAGRIPSLIPEDIYTKIVTSRRGGYCYEVNGLFAMSLTAIGFEWYFAGARPMFYPSRRPKTHLVVIVTIDGEHYLCDTGFGGYGLRQPIHIQDGEIAEQNGDRFRLELSNNEYVLSSWVNDEWSLQYGFALLPQEWIEFSLANYFNATHPDTIFTQKKLAVMQTPKGRKILVDNTLKIIENGAIDETNVDYTSAVIEHFGLSKAD